MLPRVSLSPDKQGLFLKEKTLNNDCAEISHESSGCGQCLLEFLLERLQVESCHVKLKVRTRELNQTVSFSKVPSSPYLTCTGAADVFVAVSVRC